MNKMTQDMSKKIMTRFIDIKYILRLVAHEITARRSRDYGSCPTTLRLVVILLLMMVLGVGEMYGQTTYTYYALHNKDKGYLKQVNGGIANDGTFQYADAYGSNGSSIWILSSDGYLQQEMYYLNVANGNTLYLSTEPVTPWDLIDDGTKKRLQMRGSTKILGLNDNTPVLWEPGDLTGDKKFKYAACEMTISENGTKWELKDVSFTVQSPQLVTYLRTYYMRSIIATILKNDAGTENVNVANKKDSRCYCSLTYSTTSDANKGTKWDINEATGIIYNMQASGDYSVEATYTVAALDPKALSKHPSTTTTVTLKLQPSPLAPDASKNYLLFYISNADYRFPYDDGSLNEGDAVKTNAKLDKLTEPKTNQNLDISWKVVRDDEGFYSFQSVKSGLWLRFNESHYVTGSDYGVVEMGVNGTDAPTGTEYKFRLYKSGTYGSYPSYCILPYCKQFAVFKSDGAISNSNVALNVYKTPKVISLFKIGDDSKYGIFAYEAEYRIYSAFTLTGPNSAIATGDYVFNTTESYSSRNIIGSPANSRDLEIKDSYSNSDIGFNWYVTNSDVTKDPNKQTSSVLDPYISKVASLSNAKGTLTVSVNSLPTSLIDGKIWVQAKSGTSSGGIGGENNQKWSGWKQIQFSLFGEPSYTNIASLSEITNSDGYYRLTADASDAPGVTEFNGYLDCGMHKITGTLSSPLFTTLTGIVKNLILEDVNISSHEGNTGAIACTANGSARIYNVGILGGSVGGTGYTGGLVGLLDESARVINCFSYANITGGTHVGGIVGYNNIKTTSSNLKTMVMNCMFYGDITGGTNKAPIYNGEIITNVSTGTGNNNKGVSNFNYFWGGASYVQNRDIQTYNCALMAETRFLQRFEFFRHLLNSHRELAAWWATGAAASKDMMAKWVLEPSQIGTSTPYPILKAPKDGNGNYIQYPSVVNIDAKNATTQTERNKGGKLGTLTVNIQMGDGKQFTHPGTGESEAKITTSQLTLNITDKDPDHFNFNYYKVQLPYYNDVGTMNYTGNRVVTGWKIISVDDGGTEGTFTTGDDATANADGEITATPYNFADRKSYAKDLYSKSGRIFNQGAYWDVPEGVKEITIEPYWAKAVYLADAYADVVYSTDMKTAYNVPTVGGGQVYVNGVSTFNGQKVYTLLTGTGGAIDSNVLGANTSHTVYDYAVVLVGNFHYYGSIEASKPYTVTTVDLNGDNEPDYSFILRFDGRNALHPVRFDFLNLVGLGMAQKSTGGTGTYNFGIFIPKGWFESTNTSLFQFTQFEYEHSSRPNTAPLILQGGVMEQWVSFSQNGISQKIPYYHVGGNVWFKEFHRGTHQDKQQNTKHPPISVTGGDFKEFYLTGLYRADFDNYNDNLECYINGGRFGIVAGAAQEGAGKASDHTNGNVVWQIQNADIDEFYGGGLNAVHPVEGNITTVIEGSYIKQFCGGPKFGDMNSGKTVKTTATNCKFDTYFGAGYGGNSYSRFTPSNINNINGDYGETNWNAWLNNNYTQEYNATYKGVSTTFTTQYIPMSNNYQNVARLLIDFVSFSLATTHEVTSKLTGCTITGNFYGGGSLGKVDGPVTSTLDGCIVNGNVFGAGYSASTPTVDVMNTGGFVKAPFFDSNLGVYMDPTFPATVEYNWQQRTDEKTVNSTALAIDKTNHILYTNINLDKSNLGSVNGNVTLTIRGDSKIGTEGDATKGNVFGGGEQSYVTGTAHKVTVNLQGNTEVHGNVFGGGDHGVVEGSTKVNIQTQN